jgi:two-component sensor histidine kinase
MRTSAVTGSFLLKAFLIMIVTGVLIPHKSMSQGDEPRLRGALVSAAKSAKGVTLLLDRARNYYDSEWNYDNKAKVDSAYPYLLEAKRISAAIGNKRLHQQTLVQIGAYYFRCNQIAKADQSFQKAIQYEGNFRGTAIEAGHWYEWAERTPPLDSLLNKKLSRYRQSLRLYDNLKNTGRSIWIKQCIARTYLDQGMADAAEKLLRILISHREINPHTLSYVYDLLSTVESTRGNFNNAIKYALEALKKAVKTNDLFLQSKVYSRLGGFYNELGQPKLSIEYNYYAMDALKKIKEPNVHAKFYAYTLLRQIVGDLILRRQPQTALKFLIETNAQLFPKSAFASQYVAASLGDCYAALGRYKQAESQYLLAIQRAEKNGRYMDQQKEYLNLAQMAVKWKRYDKAYRYVRKYQMFPQDNKDAVDNKEIHKIHFKIDSAGHRFVDAIRHLQAYQYMNDSIFSEKKSRQINELQIQYETSQKQQNILLLKRKSRLQQQELEAEALTTSLVLTGLIVLSIISGLLYYAYREKKKSNAKLEQQKQIIHDKNRSLEQIVEEKEELLNEKGSLLNEKDWLLKEIHHRVKNNLQVIMSLLYSQSIHLTDESAKKAIKESHQRIYSIGLIHQKLYQFESMDVINMYNYIDELIRYISNSLDIANSRVQVSVDVSPIQMFVTQAMPLGLIINEAVTNAVKYAYPDAQGGVIEIMLREKEDTYELVIKDFGVGISDESVEQSNSLGMTLMKGMTDQLDGSLSIESNAGTTISVAFKKEKGTSVSKIQ